VKSLGCLLFILILGYIQMIKNVKDMIALFNGGIDDKPQTGRIFQSQITVDD
jgi:hypothetical protein